MIFKQIDEMWEEIPGYEGFYAVSNRGRIKRLVSTTSGKAGKILKPLVVPNGYELIQLSRQGIKARCLVHRLVWIAFRDDIPDGYQINHLNGNKRDNRLENLECVTPGENQKHAFRVLKNRDVRGVKNSQAKLNPEKVREIRILLSRGQTQQSIADLYGVSQSAIGLISRGRNWSHVR